MSDDYPSFYTDAQLYDSFEMPLAGGNFLDFYKKQIENYGEPVLELGCGSGRLTIPLAKMNFDITGLDISTQMLALAKEKAGEEKVSISFIEGDMTNFDLNKKFKFIFVPAQSLSHLHTNSEVERCFACVKKHLAENGRFIIELFNPSLEILNRNPVEIYEQPNPGNVKVFSKSHYDKATQINHIELIFKDSEIKKPTILSLPMRQFFPLEIDALLKYNDFQIEHKFGNYTEENFHSGSPKQLIVCRKK